MQRQGHDILDSLSKDEQITHLRGLAASLERKIDAIAKDNDALAKDNTLLQSNNLALKKESDFYRGELNKLIEQIKIANARYWGAKSEKIKPYQISLFNDMEAAAEKPVAEPETEELLPQKKRKKKSTIDYSAFDTTIIDYELSEDERECENCGTIMGEMGIEVKHTIRLIPARLVHEEHRRHVYVCRPCSTANAKDGVTPVGIVKAEMCKMPLEKSCATPSLLAHILYQKYSLAQPVYRVAEDMRRSYGLSLTRQTLGSWVIRTHERWLAMLYGLMKKELLANDILHIDETGVQVLKEPDRKPTDRSYMWLFATAKCAIPIYIFEYHPTRARTVVTDFLRGWSGTVIADGYTVYDGLGGGIVRVSCLVHIRRKFTDIIKGLDRAALDAMPGIVTTAALERIDEIIAMDNSFDDMDSNRRKARRLMELKPKMDAFYEWCLVKRDEAMPSMALAKALNYAIGQWPNMNNALADGRLPLDNNRAEQSIRPFAIGRRNWLFSDTQLGAKASASIYSIVTTAKANGLKPREYLEWLLEEMPNTENVGDEAVLSRFLPWSDETPESCRVTGAKVATATDALSEPIIDIDTIALKEEN
jgi:transposase